MCYQQNYVMEAIGNCTYLEDLRLSGTFCDGDGAQALSQSIKKCRSLKKLEIECESSDFKFPNLVLQAIGNTTNLVDLILSYFEFDDDGVQILSESINSCEHLETVNFERFSHEVQRELEEALRPQSSVERMKPLKIVYTHTIESYRTLYRIL